MPTRCVDGESGLLVDDVERAVGRAGRVLGDEVLRSRLSKGALERARWFTWDATARRALEALAGGAAVAATPIVRRSRRSVQPWSKPWRRRLSRRSTNPTAGAGSDADGVRPAGTRAAARSSRRRTGLRTRSPKLEITASATSNTTPIQIRFPAWTKDPSQFEPGR